MRAAKWCGAGVALVALAATTALLAGAGVTSTASSGTIGTNVSFANYLFVPVKAPKVTLAPHVAMPGLKSYALKVLHFSASQIDTQVVKGLAGEYDVVITPKEKGVAAVTVDGTFTIELPQPATVVPSSGAVNVPVVIHGTMFGVKKGKVTIGGKSAKVVSWADDQITVIVPKKTPAGAQPVLVMGKTGNAATTLTYTVGTSGGGSGEYLRADFAPGGHFEVTQRSVLNFRADYSISGGVLSINGVNGLAGKGNFSVTAAFLDLTHALPVTLTPSTLPSDGGIASTAFVLIDGGVTVYGPGPDYSMTITSYAGGILTGTFAGSLARSSGAGAVAIQFASGEFRVALDVAP